MGFNSAFKGLNDSPARLASLKQRQPCTTAGNEAATPWSLNPYTDYAGDEQKCGSRAACVPSVVATRPTNQFQKHETKMYEIRQIVTLSAIIQKYSTEARSINDDTTYFFSPKYTKFRLT